MRGLSKCAMYFVPELHWLSLTDCIDEFARIMEDQVTLQHEYFPRLLHILRIIYGISRYNELSVENRFEFLLEDWESV